MTKDTENTDRIATLNDMLRQSQLTGKIVLSAGIQALCCQTQERILQGVKSYNAFAPQGTSQRERDFGAFECDDHSIFWIITYYDENDHYLSDDAADFDRTRRRLDVMLVEEYD